MLPRTGRGGDRTPISLTFCATRPLRTRPNDDDAPLYPGAVSIGLRNGPWGPKEKAATDTTPSRPPSDSDRPALNSPVRSEHPLLRKEAPVYEP